MYMDNEREIITHGVDIHILYVNVYDITRCFGGPEEGGWWYDEGELIETHRVVCHTEDECMNMARALRDELRVIYPKTGKRYSVIGGDDYDIFIEDHSGYNFPKSRPRYE